MYSKDPGTVQHVSQFFLKSLDTPNSGNEEHFWIHVWLEKPSQIMVKNDVRSKMFENRTATRFGITISSMIAS